MSGKVYGICENKCKMEVMPKTELIPFVTDFTLMDNAIHRGMVVIEPFVVNITELTPLFSAEIQFRVSQGVDQFGISHGNFEINVVGLDLAETVDGVDYYTIVPDTVYNIMCWYDGFRVNMVCI